MQKSSKTAYSTNTFVMIFFLVKQFYPLDGGGLRRIGQDREMSEVQ